MNPDLPPPPAPLDKIPFDVALPISISSPHFFHADPKLLNQFEGLSPDQAIHDVTLDLDPTTGWAITTHKRIQVCTIQCVFTCVQTQLVRKGNC